MHTKNTLADKVWFVTVRVQGSIQTTLHGSKDAAMKRKNNLIGLHNIAKDGVKV